MADISRALYGCAKGDFGMRRLIRTGLAFAFISTSWQSSAAPIAADPSQSPIERIRDSFVSAVRRCEVKPRFVPAVTVVSTPAVIAYDNDKRSIIVGRWESLPPPIQAFFGQWAAKDFPGKPPKRLYDELFNKFLVGHELGHWIADQADKPLTLDHYDAEIEANRFAIAFSDLHDPQETARIVGRFSFLSTLPNPVPVGENTRTWFNEHYDNLARSNPPAYNWYQGLFMREAWHTRKSADFCTLARRSANVR